MADLTLGYLSEPVGSQPAFHFSLKMTSTSCTSPFCAEGGEGKGCVVAKLMELKLGRDTVSPMYVNPREAVQS